jgi:hypothetical protein
MKGMTGKISASETARSLVSQISSQNAIHGTRANSHSLNNPREKFMPHPPCQLGHATHRKSHTAS